MALNPFHAFRKHQKTLLAGLTILTMIIFILTGFSGDLVSRMGNRGQGGRQKAVVTLYGKALTADDIDQLTVQREVANQYIIMVLRGSHAVAMNRIEVELLPLLKEKEDEETYTSVKGIVDNWKRLFADKAPEGEFNTRLQAYSVNVLSTRPLQDAADRTDPTAKSDQKKLLQLLIGVLSQDRQRLVMGRGRKDILYFGNGSLDNLRDLIDFEVWLHEADRLGIEVTDSALLQLLEQETLGVVRPDARIHMEVLENARKAIALNWRSLPSDTLPKALRNEYRVRLARMTVLGYEAMPEATRAVTPSVTPYHLSRFFDTHRTERDITLLAVPVNRPDFAAKVPDPPEADLRKYFDKYKTREAAPGDSEPGFKQPMRRSVEWVRARGDDPFYREEGKKAVERLHDGTLAAMQVMAGSSAASGVVLPAALVSVLPVAYDLPLFTHYERFKYEHRAPSWLEDDNMQLHDSSLNRAQNVAAMVGQAVGCGGTQGTILSAPLAFQGTRVEQEARERFLRRTEMILAAAGAQPITSAGLAYAAHPADPFRSYNEVRPAVAERQQKIFADYVAHQNLKAVGEELERLIRESPPRIRMSDRFGTPRMAAEMLGQGAASALNGTPLPLLTAVAPFSAADREFALRYLASMFMDGIGGIPMQAAAETYNLESLSFQRVRRYLADAIPRYHLESGVSEMRDRLDIGDDLALLPLKDAFLKPRFHFGQPKKEADFAQLFFKDQFQPIYRPAALPDGSFTSPVEIQDSEWKMSSEPMLYWTRDEQDAYVPNYEEVRARVLKSWKTEKARGFAKKEAERIAAKASVKGADGARVLRDEGVPFTLNGVARITKTPSRQVFARPGAGMGYQRFKVPEDKVEFPSARFAEELFRLKDGEAIVLGNRPEDIYYVAVVSSKPITPDFYSELALNERELMNELDQDEHVRLRYRDGIRRQLERDAKLDVNREYEKTFGNRNRSSSAGDD